MIAAHDPIAQLLTTCELVGDASRYDLLAVAAIETGGEFKEPVRNCTWDDGSYHLKAHGIFAQGTSRAEVMRNWMRAARRHVDVFAELIMAEQIVTGEAGQVTKTQMRRACQIILGPNFNGSKSHHTRQVFAAAEATLKVLNRQAA